jgi:hypothetical protein
LRAGFITIKQKDAAAFYSTHTHAMITTILIIDRRH